MEKQIISSREASHEEFVLNKKLLFNPNGNDNKENKRIINGNTTNLLDLTNVKYGWVENLYQSMMGNFWVPEKTSMTEDKLCYNGDKLTTYEQTSYDGILSFLVFLDSLQTHNLPNISSYITAPEINFLLSIQEFQEAIHSKSYAHIIESILPKAKRMYIYDYWRDDPVLLERISFIAKIYQDFQSKKNITNFVKSVWANYLLESIYFYNGFQFFYGLASRGLMINSSVQIRYINRDELTHVSLFRNILKELMREEPKVMAKMETTLCDMMGEAVRQEINWTEHIIGNNILGITTDSTKQYTEDLSNIRMKAVGYEMLYQKRGNPYSHLEGIADDAGHGTLKSNVFESTSTAYKQASIFTGWDEI